MTRHVPLPRDEQSSGFFDLDVLYTRQVEQMRMPLMPLAPVAPVARGAPRVQVVEAAPRTVEGSAARRGPIGWFAMFVAWLATMTTAVLVTTQLPGHIRPRTRVATPTPTPTPIQTPIQTPTASGPPVVAFSDLPRALPATRPQLRHWASHASAAAQPAHEVALPPVPPANAVAAPPSQPAPAPNATPSLEDLIRHEVAAEQKRLHGAPGR